MAAIRANRTDEDEITSATRRPLRNRSNRLSQIDLVTPLSVRRSRSRQAQAYILERDFKYLEREQKVTSILNSGAFRTELEGILQSQLDGSREPRKSKPDLQRLQDNIVPASRFGAASNQKTSGGETVIPINDLRGTSASKYTVAERQTRCKLAAVYRLADLFGWGQLIYNHITARAPGEEDYYLVNPFGLMYQEVTASNLVKVDQEGQVEDAGTTQLGINAEGFSLHSAIHSARKDIKCIFHVHNTATLAVSAMSCGLMPISSEAASLGGISYHDYKGSGYNYEEDSELAEDLGPTNKVLVLRNHGVIAMGQSIEEAFHQMHKLVKACEMQVAVMSAGLANIRQVPEGVWQRGGASVRSGSSPSSKKQQIWDIEFEALMRMLDNRGYNTGYLYKGMSLLQPGSPRKETLKKKTESMGKAQHTGTDDADVHGSTRDPWYFLEEGKTPGDKPITKAKQRHKSAREPAAQEQLWEFLENEQSKDGSSTPVASQLQRVGDTKSRGQPQNVPKKSASSHEHGPADEDRHLTSLEMAELTAQRVAISTGKAVETLVKQNLQARSRDGALKATEKKQFSPSTIHRPAEITIPSNLTPLQQVEYTAEQVAHSTGEAVEKLAARRLPMSSDDASHSPTHYTLSTRLSTDQTPKHTKRRRRGSERNRALTNGPVQYPHTSETDSDSEVYTTSSQSKKSTPTHSAAKTGTLISLSAIHTPASIAFKEGSSPAEKMTHTAEVVAKSTSRAVQKLSSTLTVSSPVSGNYADSHADSV